MDDTHAFYDALDYRLRAAGVDFEQRYPGFMVHGDVGRYLSYAEARSYVEQRERSQA